MKCIDNIGVKYSEASRTRGRLITSAIALSTSLMFVIGILVIMTFGIWIKWDVVFFGEFDAVYAQVTDEQATSLSKVDSFNSVGERQLLGLIKDQFHTYQVITADDSILTGFNYDLLEGDYPVNSYDIVLSESAISYLGATGEIGEEITLSYSSLDDIQRQEIFTLTGILKDNIYQEDGYKETFIVSESFAEDVSKDFIRKDVYVNKKMFVSTDDLLDIGSKFNISNDRLGLPMSNSEIVNGILVPSVLVAGLVVLLSIVSVGNIFSYSINERIKTIGLLKSIGMTHKQLKKVFIKEGYQFLKKGIVYGLLLGIFAFLIIIFGQYLVTDSINNNDSLISKLDLNIFLIRNVWYMVLFMLLLTFITSWIAVTFSIYIPFRKTKRISITSSINYVGNKNIRSKSRRNAFIKKPAAKLAIINFKTSKVKTILPSIFLALSAAFFIFLSSFLNSMDSRILADGITEGDIVVDGVISSDLLDDIRNVINVEDICVMKKVDVIIPFEDVSVSEGFINGEDFLKSSKEDGKLGLETKLIGYNEAMFNELEASPLKNNEAYLYDRYGYSNYEIGDEIKQVYVDDSGNEIIINVIIKSYTTSVIHRHLPYVYGSPLIIVNDSLLVNKLGVTDYDRAGIFVDGDIKIVKQEIVDITDDKVIEITTIDEVEQDLFEEFFLISSMGYGLFIVIGLVSFTMIINNIYTSITSRKQEFAILRSVGMTKNQLKKYLLWEANIYMILVVLISIPLGYFLGKYVVDSLAEQNTHFIWTFPLSSLLIIVAYYLIIYIVTRLVFNKMDTLSIADLFRN
ncbi:FtsX-like permease family protein [Mycoplasmatota bacterium WC44]